MTLQRSEAILDGSLSLRILLAKLAEQISQKGS